MKNAVSEYFRLFYLGKLDKVNAIFYIKIKGGIFMLKNKKAFFAIISAMLLLCVLLEIHLTKNDIRPDDEENSWNNKNISSDEITALPSMEVLSSASDFIMLDITNNSEYPVYLDCGVYNIYEKIENCYVLVDEDKDGFTYYGKINLKAVESHCTDQIYFYLGVLTDSESGYTHPGKYIIKIPLNKDSVITADFEITDETLNPDTGISIICSAKYSIDSDSNFSYTVINNSKEDINVSLSVIISKYQDGRWARLPLSEKYYDAHYSASLWSENLPAGSQRTQKFCLSLADMVGIKLTPGKYRLEKQIAFNWYFAEFEIY